MVVVAGEDRGRVRAVAGRHRAGHRLVLARSSRPGDATWTVLADPEGNEFRVLQSHDSLIF